VNLSQCELPFKTSRNCTRMPMSWQLILMDDATSPSSTGQGVTYTTTETWQNALVANVVK